jgi:hypothetical protein
MQEEETSLTVCSVASTQAMSTQVEETSPISTWVEILEVMSVVAIFSD